MGYKHDATAQNEQNFDFLDTRDMHIVDDNHGVREDDDFDDDVESGDCLPARVLTECLVLAIHCRQQVRMARKTLTRSGQLLFISCHESRLHRTPRSTMPSTIQIAQEPRIALLKNNLLCRDRFR